MDALKTRTGKKIEQLRLGHNLTKGQLATAAGITYQTLTRIEEGKGSTDLDTIESLAHQLGVEPYELLKPAISETSLRERAEQADPLDKLQDAIDAMPDPQRQKKRREKS